MIKNNLKFNKGFTLVEMMVSIAVFSVVMVVAATALLSIIDANQKAQSIKTAINTINFALEGISKDVRVGSDYECVNEQDFSPIVGDCTAGETMFRYRSNRAYQNPETGQYGFAYYRYNSNTKSIESCLQEGSSDTCQNDTGFVGLTNLDEITIDKMNFYVLGKDSVDGEKRQPRLIITLEGTAGKKDKTKTTFNLQTTVSQRTRN